MKTTKKSAVKKPGNKTVDRKFLMQLADRIYNPKTKQFLRLCTNHLQSGRDPSDSVRPMHCGIGELYYAMTDRHPRDARISDADKVIDLAVKMSPLPMGHASMITAEKAKIAAARNAISKIKFKDNNLDVELFDRLDTAEDDLDCLDDPTEDFRKALNEVIDANDNIDDLTTRGYQTRARHVAEQFRNAAKLLPAK